VAMAVYHCRQAGFFFLLHKQKKEHTTYVTMGRSLGAVFFVCLIKEVSELSMTKKKALENSAIYKQKKEHKT